MLKKAVQQGRSERRGEAYFVAHVEPLSDARTLLADPSEGLRACFFSILRRGQLLMLAGCVCLSAGAVLAASGEATAVVNRVQTSLISVMKEATQLGYEGRFSGLESVVWETHDIPFVAKVALGKHWPRLDEHQRSAFVSTFAKLSTATYAARFDEYHGERFRIVAESPLPRGKGMLVESRLIKSNGEEVHFNYLLHRVGNDWKIINIIVNGVSDLAVKRAEYAKLMEESGFSALMARLEEQILAYAAGR